MKNIMLTVLVCCLGMQGFSQTAKPVEAARKKMTMPEVVLQIVQNMVRIEGGTYKMGCQNESDSDCYYWEKPAHKVSVSSFYMDKYPNYAIGVGSRNGNASVVFEKLPYLPR